MRAEYLAIVFWALAISGCGITAKGEARDDMMQAQAAYTQCLQQNRAETALCDGYKQIYEADVHTYRTASAGNTPMGLPAGSPLLDAIAGATGYGIASKFKLKTPPIRRRSDLGDVASDDLGRATDELIRPSGR